MKVLNIKYPYPSLKVGILAKLFSFIYMNYNCIIYYKPTLNATLVYFRLYLLPCYLQSLYSSGIIIIIYLFL